MDAICPTVVGSLVRIWTTLHKDLNVEMDGAEIRYLRRVVFAMDDELVAGLLAAKLAMARQPAGGGPAHELARKGCEVLYAVQGRRCRARLVHGSASDAGLLGTGTRFGAALLGLRAGQSLLWPLAQGRLVELRLLEVAVPDSVSDSLANTARPTRTPCEFG